MKEELKEILEENQRRNALLDAPYDPVLGIGGPIKRFRIDFKDPDVHFFIPVGMKTAPITSHILRYGSLRKAAVMLKTDTIGLTEAFVRERFKYDFEFWAYSTIQILDKDTFINVKFKLRGAQRKLLKAMEDQRTANLPIRIILLKARQWGGSTLVQMYMFWIQQIHHTNWHLAVCAQDDNAARNISGMYDTAAKLYPGEIDTITFKSHEKSTKNRKCVERGGIIGVGSVNNPDQFRSYNYAMAHLSEVGLWQDTPKRAAVNLITSLKETVPDQPYTVIVEESTAKGLNYFHKSYSRAKKGHTRYKAVFVAWHEIDRCRIPLDVSPKQFIKSLSDYEWYLWKIGATLEGINWYRKHKEDKGYDDWDMMSENPSNEKEAFQSSGQRVYPQAYVDAVRRYCKEPIFKGEIFAKTRIGEFAFDDIYLEKTPRGKLWIWKRSEELLTLPIKNRFGAFVDIGGTSRKADYSVFKLLDRAPMTYGEDPEVVAVWHGHLDQDLLAWKCAQICMLYAQPEIGEYPLLAFEVQSLNEKGTEGNHTLTILDQLKDFYPNLYIRNDHEKLGDEFVAKYGFHTNPKTKGLIIDTHKGAMREKYLAEREQQQNWGYVERDDRACDEFQWFEVKNDGKMGNIEGEHDDHVIATAGAVWLVIKRMDLPFVVQERPKVKTKRQRGYSSF
jgi:hypothetical protein